MKRLNKIKAALCLLAIGATFAFVGCNGDKPKDISVESYTITFSTGSGDAQTQEGYKGEKINQPDTPEKSGYYFRGWYKGNADGSQLDETPFDFTQSTLSGDVYLFAKWEKIPLFGAEVTETANGIQVTGVGNEYEYEYRVNGGAYSESPSFAATMGTEYVVSVRRKSTTVTYPDKTIKIFLSESNKLDSLASSDPVGSYGFAVEETSEAAAIYDGADDNFAAKITLTKTSTSTYINMFVRAIDKVGVKFQMKVVDAANPATPVTSMAIKTNQNAANINLPTPTSGEWTEVKLLPWGNANFPADVCLLQFSELSQSVIIYIDEITPITNDGELVSLTAANSTALNSLGDAHELTTSLQFANSSATVGSIGYGHNRGISVNLGGMDLSAYESLQFTLRFTRQQTSGANLDYYIGKAMPNTEFVNENPLSSSTKFTKIGTYDDTLATDTDVQVSVKISTLQALGIDITNCDGFSFAYNDNTAPTAVSVLSATLSIVQFVLK